jgi:hypothetical protein
MQKAPARQLVSLKNIPVMVMSAEGSLAEVDPRFDHFIQPTIDAHLADSTDDELRFLDSALLRHEARADIFALNCCFSIYGPELAETTLRSFCSLLIHGATALNVLHAVAHDLHRQNTDPMHQVIDIDFVFALWSHRQAIMTRYLDGFIFEGRTIVCADSDDFGANAFPADAIDALLDSQRLVRPFSEDTRRVSELISRGFAEAPNAFDAVIRGSRVTSRLKAEARAPRRVTFTGVGERDMLDSA